MKIKYNTIQQNQNYIKDLKFKIKRLEELYNKLQKKITKVEKKNDGKTNKSM